MLQEYYIPGISYKFGRSQDHGWLLVNDGSVVHTLREISRSQYDELWRDQMAAPVFLYRQHDMMPRNIHNISVYKVGFFRKAYTCSCGITVYGTVFPSSQLNALHEAREKELQDWTDKAYDANYWIFQGKYYWDDENLTSQEVYALLVAKERRRKARIERAMAMVAMGDEPRTPSADRIPDDVKQLVWLRDDGKCVSCGSTTELQYDHIIPRAKGGTSSDAANIQILCGPCNRRKSDGLTIR